MGSTLISLRRRPPRRYQLKRTRLDVLIDLVEFVGIEEPRPSRHPPALPSLHRHDEEVVLAHSVLQRLAKIGGILTADRIKSVAAKTIGIVFLESGENGVSNNLAAFVVLEYLEVNCDALAVRVLVFVLFGWRPVQRALQRQNVAREIRSDLGLHILMRGHRNFSEVADAAVANLRRKIGGFRGIVMIMVRYRDPGGTYHLFVDRMTGEAVEAVRHYLFGRL